MQLRLRAAGVVGGLMLVATTLSACEETRAEGRSAGGPLKAVSLGAQVYREGGDERVITFGGVSLCAVELDQGVEIERVRPAADPAPETFAAWLRTVPAAGARIDGAAYDWRPISTATGFPGKPAAMSDGPYRGTFTRQVSGVEIDLECEAVGDLDARRYELLTVVKVGPAGTAIPKVYIDYKVGARQYTLTVPVRQRVCGTAVTEAC